MTYCIKHIHRQNKEWLASLFSKYGEVQEAEVIRYKQSGRSKGYAFVKLTSDIIDACLNDLHQSCYEERTLKVEVAEERLNFPDLQNQTSEQD